MKTENALRSFPISFPKEEEKGNQLAEKKQFKSIICYKMIYSSEKNLKGRKHFADWRQVMIQKVQVQLCV